MAERRSDFIGSRARAARNRVRRQRGPCSLCGQPIDYDLPSKHPMSFTVDHVDPQSLGGALFDARNLRPAHRKCNSARGNRPVDAVVVVRQSRRW